MTSISLKISLAVVHLTTTPLTHILFYRIAIVKLEQCSGTFTLEFLVGYDYVESSSTLRDIHIRGFRMSLLHSQ